MSIIGNFLRVTPAELAHLRDDTTRVHPFVHGIVMAELKGPPLPPEQARSLCVEKCWNALSYLLGRVDFPLDVFHDGAGLGELNDDGTQRRCLSVEQVRTAAEWFTLVDFDELIQDIDPADPATQVYWVRWDEPTTVDFLRTHFDETVRFFTAAAANGEAVLRYYT